MLALHRRDESGAQRDLGLAEADVAAHQPVHRPPAFQVGKHIGDGAVLVVGFLPRETVGELTVGAVFGGQHRRLAQRARRSGLEQLVGDLADAFAHPGASALPCLPAQPVELNGVFG